MNKLLAAAILSALGLSANAQMTIDFDADTTTGNGSVTPTLTWATNPPADTCQASGQWSGEKGPSGSETLPPMTSSGTFNLECTWPGDSIATLTWELATENTDGSPYTDPALVKLKYGFISVQDLLGNACTSGFPGMGCADAIHPQTMHTVTGIVGTGEWNAVGYSVNERGVFSEASEAATKVFTGLVTVTESVGITVNPVPGAISNFSVD